LLLCPWERSGQPLPAVAAQLQSLWEEAAGPAAAPRGTVGVVIGPEGGLAAHEVQELLGLVAIAVSLGPRILRTETAAIAALSVVMALCGEFARGPAAEAPGPGAKIGDEAE
jgi:16S rRNA U1498 N3-methylase RsmE